MIKRLRFNLNQRWISLFSLWLLLLSGVLTQFVGSPGILQALRLKNHLMDKTDQLNKVQEALAKLELESLMLQKSRVVQEREIRKVLGYAASDELIYDFSGSDSE